MEKLQNALVRHALEGVSGQIQTSFRPLLGLSLGYLSFQYLFEYLLSKTAVLEIKKLQGELGERKLISPKESVLK
jgi:hypothetical protein